MIRSIALSALLTLLMCSCARGSQLQHTGTVTARPAAPSVIQQATPPPPAPASTTAETTESQQATAAQEKGENQEDDPQAARGDSGLERLAQLPASAQLPGGRWKPGQNYDPLVPAQPTNAGPGKVEVTEVFWLGCPHCAALEPFIQGWLKTKPAYIDFVRVPVMWGPVHRAHAHLFYTLEALNRNDLVEKAFDTIQKEHQMLVGPSEDDTLKAQQAYAAANGVSTADFMKAYNSFSVNSNLQRAEQLTQRYHVEGVPLVVINGKYTTDVGKAGSQANLIQLIDDLAAAEHNKK